MFEAVIFDCDGVLVDSEILAVAEETAALAEIGLVYDPSEFMHRFVGLHDAAFEAALDADSRERLGRPLPQGFLRHVHERRRTACEQKLQAVPGAAEAIAAWGERPKAVASSTGEDFLRLKLGVTGLWPLFDPHAYSADRCAQGKPAPDVFLLAAQAIGVRPDRCLAIEDSVNGVRAGLAAGMTVWGFTGGGHMDEAAARRLAEAGAHRMVGGWDEAEALFAAHRTAA